MSFSRISTLALALAAGLGAPVSAATAQWSVAFTASTNGGGLPGNGTGSFTVEELARNGPLVALSSWSFTFTLLDSDNTPVVDGVTYTEDTPTITGTAPRFGFRSDGTAFLDMSNTFEGGNALTLGGPQFGDGFLFETPACVEAAPAAACGLIWQGSYTLTRAGADSDPPVNPLPASAALLPLGLGALALIRRRKTGAPHPRPS
jgi:hypothetical protein